MKDSFDFEFKPLSFSSWVSLFQKTGLLGYACILIAISGKFFDLRTSSDVVSGALSNSMVYRSICLSIAIFIIMGFLLKPLRVPTFIGLKSIVIYGLICIISTSWSSIPIASFGKSIELFTGILVIVVAASQKNAEKKMISLFNMIIYLVAIQIVIIFIFWLIKIPGFSEKASGGLSMIVPTRMKAPFISANSIGYYSALILIFLLNTFYKKKDLTPKRISYMLFFLATMILSTSRTSLGIMIFSIFYFIYCNKKKQLFFITIFFSLIFLWDFSKIGSSIFQFIQGNQAAHVTMSLSGRTVLWQHAFELSKEHPIIGLGYGVGSRIMFFFSKLEGFGETISSAHNGFLEVFMGLGLIGFAPWCIALYSFLRISLKKYKVENSQSRPIWAIWPVVFAASTMSLGVGGNLNELFLLFMIVIAIIDNEKQRSNGYEVRVSW